MASIHRSPIDTEGTSNSKAAKAPLASYRLFERSLAAMGYLAKRGVALFIDALIFGGIYTLAQKYIPFMDADPPTFLYVIMLCPFFFKDAIANGTSIGKRVMRLAVYKASWEKPSFWESFKRTLLVTSAGYLVFLKACFSEEGVLAFFDWERDTLKAVVIETELEKSISDTAESKEHRLALYNEHLRSVYAKK